VAALKIPDGLILRVSTNVKKKTTMIVTYRKGQSKRAFKAILPMCVDEKCRLKQPHSQFIRSGPGRYQGYNSWTIYHPRDVDALIVKIAKSYW
jgi:hypothetical protein